MPRNRDARIGILGAGAAGLSAAHFLQERGYTNVTVFEKEQRVGGKCHTMWVDDRWYDLGAVGVTIGFHAVRALAREFDVDVPAKAHFGHRLFDADSGVPINLSVWQNLRVLFEVARFLFESARFRAILRPGLEGIDQELAVPFGAWARKRGLEALLPIMTPWNVGFGYGYLEEVPAAYVLKYNEPLLVLPALLRQGLYSVDRGFQHLWDEVAKSLNVRMGVAVHGIERSESTVTLRCDTGSEVLDELIVTAPLPDMLAIMDCDAQEQELFSRVRWYDYYVFCASVRGLVTSGGYYPKNCVPGRPGRLLANWRRWQDDDVANLYALAPSSMDVDTVQRLLAQDVAAGGATFGDVRFMRKWQYFHHVTPEDMARGFYDRLEARQGVRNTYLAGEVMNFATTEHVVRYSKHLVDRFF
jgi:hypothetical protein